jgi:hypothetical protein
LVHRNFVQGLGDTCIGELHIWMFSFCSLPHLSHFSFPLNYLSMWRTNLFSSSFTMYGFSESFE